MAQRRQSAFKQKFTPVEVQAINVNYSVNGKQLLHNVSATFGASQVSALMGPSGAGKTTLMNVLAARVSGDVTGKVLVNGRELSKAQFRTVLTLMPQADILHSALSVESCIRYAALLRCPPTWTYEEKMDAMERLMDVLGLARVRKNQIGDEH